MFDVPDDPRKGKFVVEVDFKMRGQRSGKRLSVNENAVVSGGVVERHNIVGSDFYQSIEGKL